MNKEKKIDFVFNNDKNLNSNEISDLCQKDLKSRNANNYYLKYCNPNEKDLPEEEIFYEKEDYELGYEEMQSENDFDVGRQKRNLLVSGGIQINQ